MLDSESGALLDLLSFLACEFFPPLNNASNIDWTLFHHDASSPCLFWSDESTSWSTKRIVYGISDLRRVQNHLSKERNGFHSRVDCILANFCECENTLRFSSIVSVFSMPSIGDELMLRKIVEPSDNCTIFYPDDELGELPTCSFHAISESKDHLIWVKDITCVFLSKEWDSESHPFFSKACICFIGLEPIIGYIFMM